MSTACAVVSVAWTLLFPAILCALCWQNIRTCCNIPVRSTGRLTNACEHDKHVHLAAFSRHAIRDLHTTVPWPAHGPALLICWHLFVLAIVIFTIIFELAGPPSLAPGWYYLWFGYLTNWTWCLLGARAVLGVFVCVQARRSAKLDCAQGSQEAAQYSWLHKAFAVLSAILPTASIIVTVGYWAAVKGVGGRIYLDEPLKHGANALFMLLEVALTRLPVTSTWVVYPVTYLAFYTIFQVIYWAGSEEWVYSRTDFTDCKILPGYILLPVGAVGVYFLTYGLAKLRNKLWQPRADFCEDVRWRPDDAKATPSQGNSQSPKAAV